MITGTEARRSPAGGETFQVVRPAGETDGEHVLVLACVEPDGCAAIGYLHPHQTEVLKVIDGSVGFEASGKLAIAGPGENVVVESGTAHHVREHRSPKW